MSPLIHGRRILHRLQGLFIVFRAFESVVEHMEKNAKNIDALRLKVEAKHSSAVTDKEIETRMKEQQLKGIELILLFPSIAIASISQPMKNDC